MGRALKLALSACALAGALGAGAAPGLAQAQRVPPIGTRPVLEDPFPAASVVFPEAVRGYPDLVFARAPGYRPLRLDLYVPAQARDDRRLPLVIFLHGGGWLSGHTRHAGAFENWPEVLAGIAARGYIVASVDYRLSSEARFPAQVHDIRAAIRWLKSKGARWHIDGERVLLWGTSAGAQVAALAATACGEPGELVPPAGWSAAVPDCVQGLVAWYGVFDIPAIANLSLPGATAAELEPVRRYLGCEPAACPELAKSASPITHVTGDTPPTLLIHGDRDHVVPVSQSHAFDAALRRHEVPSELHVFAGIDHSFIGEDAARTREASLEAWRITVDFIARTLGGPRS